MSNLLFIPPHYELLCQNLPSLGGSLQDLQSYVKNSHGKKPAGTAFEVSLICTCFELGLIEGGRLPSKHWIPKLCAKLPSYTKNKLLRRLENLRGAQSAERNKVLSIRIESLVARRLLAGLLGSDADDEEREESVEDKSMIKMLENTLDSEMYRRLSTPKPSMSPSVIMADQQRSAQNSQYTNNQPQQPSNTGPVLPSNTTDPTRIITSMDRQEERTKGELIQEIEWLRRSNEEKDAQLKEMKDKVDEYEQRERILEPMMNFWLGKRARSTTKKQ